MTTSDSIEPTTEALLQGQWQPLQALLTASYGENRQGEATPQQLPGLLAGLTLQPGQTLLEGLFDHTGGHYSLSADSYALAAFADQLFNNVQKNSKLHPQMQQCLDVFRLPLLHSLCRQQLPWQDSTSPVNVFSTLLPAICGWQPELGRAADKFTQALTPLLQQLTHSPPDAQPDPAVRLEQFIDREQQRIKKLEERIRAAETGQLQARHARQLTAKTLNQQMAGKRLPATISRFLHGPWQESMRLVLLNEGRDSEQWRKIIRLTETLVWSVQPIADNEQEEKRQHIYHSISELSEELREITIGLHHSSALDEELARVELEHLKILKGEPLDYQPFQLIDNTDSLINAQISVSNNLIKNVTQLEPGQWFIYAGDSGEQRIKLTIKMDQGQQLLFTNFLGIKAELFNYEEFAYMLSSRIATPLNTRDLLRTLGEKMLTNLLQRHRQKQASIAREKAAEAERHRQQEAARLKALEESIALAKAAEEALERERQEKALRQQQHEQQQLHDALLSQLKALQTGARVNLIDDDGHWQACRLAAVLQSSGEYIFVNGTGVKQLTATRERLVTLLADGKVKIIDQGSNFDNTLEQVVNSLRVRKKP